MTTDRYEEQQQCHNKQWHLHRTISIQIQVYVKLNIVNFCLLKQSMCNLIKECWMNTRKMNGRFHHARNQKECNEINLNFGQNKKGRNQDEWKENYGVIINNDKRKWTTFSLVFQSWIKWLNG